MPRKKTWTASEMGKKGGATRTSKPKGLAALSPKKRAEISRLGGLAKAAAREG